MTKVTYAERVRWRKLAIKVQHHDHSCEYSDDAQVWRRGCEERKLLVKELQEIPMAVAAAIVLRHVPKEFQSLWIKASGTLP